MRSRSPPPWPQLQQLCIPAGDGVSGGACALLPGDSASAEGALVRTVSQGSCMQRPRPRPFTARQQLSCMTATRCFSNRNARFGRGGFTGESCRP
eukprot:354734-Chlamydomonas_euryale.AAC.4